MSMMLQYVCAFINYDFYKTIKIVTRMERIKNCKMLHRLCSGSTVKVSRRLLKISALILSRMNCHGTQTRGSLIVIEGCDRSGKTTQCSLLQENLTSSGYSVKPLKFPDRTTVIGQMINDYLACKQDVDDHAVHLLFSANRWERVSMMLKLLEQGTSLIVDRYAYSGVCYTAAKKGFDMSWCKQPDIGLPRPDAIVYLTLSSEAAAQRGNYGEERYRQTDFQKKVANNFAALTEDSWKVIDANKSIEDLQAELLDICKETIKRSSDQPIYKLWMDGTF